MKLWRTLLVLLFAVPVVWAQRSPRVVDSLAAMAALPRSSANPDVLVQGANGGSFKWVGNSTAATNVADVVASPYGAASGRYIRQPLIGGTVDLGSAGITFDGGTNGYPFTIQDTSSTSIEGGTAQLTGLTDLTLDGQRDLTIYGRTNLFLITPRVWALQAEVGGALELMDGSVDLGKADFKVNRITSVSALKALPAAAYQDGAIITTLGYHTAGDGGGATYRYSSASSATADDGLVIAPAHGAGRFLLQHNKNVSLLVFGAKGDAAYNNTAAMTAAVAALNAGTIGSLYVPTGTYYLRDNYSFTGSNIRIYGDGAGSMLVGERAQSGKTYLFRWYGQNIHFDGIGMRRLTNTDTNTAVAYMKLGRFEQGCRNFHMTDCYVDGNAAGQIARSGYYYTEFDADGRDIATQPTGLYFHNNYFTGGTSRFFDLISVRSVFFTDNFFYNCGTENYTGSGGTFNGGTCIELQSHDTAPSTMYWCYGATISNNIFEYWGDGAINCAGAYDVTITGNEMRGAGFFGLPPAANNQSENGIAFFGGGRVTITGNKAYLLDETAILVRGQSSAGVLGKSVDAFTIANNVCIGGVTLSTNICSTHIRILCTDPTTATPSVTHRSISVIGNMVKTSTTSQGALLQVEVGANASLIGLDVSGNHLYGAGTGAGTTAGILFDLSASAGTVAAIRFERNQFYDLPRGISLVTATTFPAGTYAPGNQFNNVTTHVFNATDSATARRSLMKFDRDDHLAIGNSGLNPAASGVIRLPNATSIQARNVANTGDINLIESSSADTIRLGGGLLNVLPSTSLVRVGTTAKFVLGTPSVSTVTAGATLSSSASSIRVAGSGGAVTLSATTAISAGSEDGQILMLVGTDDTNTVTVPNTGNMYIPSSVTLGRGDTLVLVWYNSATSFNAGWRFVAQSNNPQ